MFSQIKKKKALENVPLCDSLKIIIWYIHKRHPKQEPTFTFLCDLNTLFLYVVVLNNNIYSCVMVLFSIETTTKLYEGLPISCCTAPAELQWTRLRYFRRAVRMLSSLKGDIFVFVHRVIKLYIVCWLRIHDELVNKYNPYIIIDFIETMLRLVSKYNRFRAKGNKNTTDTSQRLRRTGIRVLC